jgi:hypothetical protein
LAMSSLASLEKSEAVFVEIMSRRNEESANSTGTAAARLI